MNPLFIPSNLHKTFLFNCSLILIVIFQKRNQLSGQEHLHRFCEVMAPGQKKTCEKIKQNYSNQRTEFAGEPENLA